MLDDPLANSDAHASYSQYLEYATKAKIEPSRILTYDEFIGNLPDDEISREKIRLGFNIPVIGRGQSIAQQVVNAANLIDQTVNTAETVMSATELARAALKRGIDRVSSSDGSPPSAGQGDKFMDVQPPGNSSDGGWDSGDHFDVQRLNLNARPIEVSLNTGIIPNTYGQHYLDADKNHSPFHMTGFRLAMPTVTSDRFYTFFDNVLSLAYQTISQAAVAFNISAYQNLSTNRLYEYLNSLMYALQVYYFYASILTYSSNPQNRNQGMLNLRKAMTADDLDDLYQLKRMLEGIPIPPNLNNLVFYLMQTYQESSLPGSAIIKFQPFPFTDAPSYIFSQLQTGQVTAAISLLTTSTFRLTESLIARVCKEWLLGTLLAPSDVPLHDSEFTTIWANAPCVYIGDPNNPNPRTPFIATENDTIIYNAFSNDMDGAVYGLTTLWNTSTNGYLPGLVDPYVASSKYVANAITQYTNRVSYYTDRTTGISGFYPVGLVQPYQVFSRCETYKILNSVLDAYQFAFSEAALNVSVASVRQTAYKLLEWLLSLDTIKSNRMSSSNSSPRNKSTMKRRGKRGSKPKFKSSDKDEMKE